MLKRVWSAIKAVALLILGGAVATGMLFMSAPEFFHDAYASAGVPLRWGLRAALVASALVWLMSVIETFRTAAQNGRLRDRKPGQLVGRQTDPSD